MGAIRNARVPGRPERRNVFMGPRDATVMINRLRSMGLHVEVSPEKVVGRDNLYVADVFDRETKVPKGKRWLWHTANGIVVSKECPPA